MADLKVRNLDDGVASALRARAKARGISLEGEIRRTLTADRVQLVRRAKALHAAAAARPAKQSAKARGPSAQSGMPGDGSCAPETSRLERRWLTSRCATSTTASPTS